MVGQSATVGRGISGWRVAARAGWGALTVFYGAFVGVEVWNHGVLALIAAFVFFIAPDFTMFIDARRGGGGRLGPRAVPFYNAAHRAVIPLALAVVYSVSAIEAPALFAGLLGWLGHIAMDRTFGYGLRAADGSRRG
ncbi:DUF4260 family protein [Actinomadura gamaensis]|uniref:DUF4260 family protein n=1 Tax=Actinomadura gamaensis TaxID=1763541 RepID=A0ABV9U5K1_9ACTN